MSRIVGIFFRGTEHMAELPTDGHHEVAIKICHQYDLTYGRNDPVDFLISKGAIKLGNRYGNSQIVVFKGSLLDNDTANEVLRYVSKGWEIIDLDQSINWQFWKPWIILFKYHKGKQRALYYANALCLFLLMMNIINFKLFLISNKKFQVTLFNFNKSLCIYILIL